MTFFNRLLVVLVILACSGKLLAAELESGITVKEIWVRGNTFNLVVERESTTNPTSVCYFAPHSAVAGQYFIGMSYVPGATTNLVDNRDDYKMIWSTANTAFALNKKISLELEPGYYGICTFSAVHITSEDVVE